MDYICNGMDINYLSELTPHFTEIKITLKEKRGKSKVN